MGFSFKAMWANKCPKCRHGKIFNEPLKISDPLDMPSNCKYCKQATEPEPGFYYGAMFMSYLLSIVLILGPMLLLVFYFKWSLNSAMALVLFIAMVSYLKLARVSRSFWLHLMVAYDPKLAKEIKNKNSKLLNQNWTPRTNKL